MKIKEDYKNEVISSMKKMIGIQRDLHLQLIKTTHQNTPHDAVCIVGDLTEKILDKASTKFRRDTAFKRNYIRYRSRNMLYFIGESIFR